MKRILVIEDRSPMLEALRAVLEEADQNYQVHGVPSAEEALLELRRISFDLLITDVRLPGMSGFELVGKVKDREPDLPIIMITAYASQQGRTVAEKLGVAHYLAKPVDADLLTNIIQDTIRKAEATIPPPVGEEPPDTSNESAASPVLLKPGFTAGLRDRIEQLQADVGSGQIMLINRAGDVLIQVGEKRGLNQRALAQTIAAIMDNSARLRGQLGGGQPAAVHYLAGSELDVFCASVGEGFCLALLLGASGRRGRLGTVWTFTRRAVSELRVLIGDQAVRDAAPPIVSSEAEAVTGEVATQTQPEADLVEDSPAQATSLGVESRAVVEPKPVEPSAETETSSAAAAAAEAALPADGGGEAGQLTIQELQNLLDLEPGEVAVSDLDEFWDEATVGDPVVPSDQGNLSFEEARRLGLLPPDFDVDAEDEA